MMFARGLKRSFSLLTAGGLVLAVGCDRRQEDVVSDAARAGKTAAQAAGDTARQAGKAAKDVAGKAKTAADELLARVKSEMEDLDRSRPGLEKEAGKLKGKASIAADRTLDYLKRQGDD